MKKTLSLVLALVLALALCSFASADTTYTQSPWLDEKVASGEIPAVADRLPSDPNVTEVAEVGQYGGTWRQAVTSGTFNHAHHHLTGYLANNAIIYAQDNTTITTNYLSEFSYNDEMTVFTFKLRDGLKWSDGVTVTTEDVSFWFNDYILNTELCPTNTYYPDATLTIVDELTWTLTFETAKPLYPAYWAYNNNSNFIFPAHYLKQFHASYLTEEELTATLAAEGFDDWTTMFEDKYNDQVNMDLPVVGPYIMTSDPAKTNTITFVRNPYYFAVDQNGQQLPYIDEAVIAIVDDTDQVNAKVIAGEVDVQVACVQESLSNYPLFAQYADEMGYHIEVSDFNEPNAMNFHFNVCTTDPVKAPYLSSAVFHQALSLGFDRESVIATFYTVGPYQSVPAQTSFLESSPYYSEEFATQYTEFDAETANAKLDELGMTTYDENGWRMTANGEEFALVVLCPNYDSQWIEVVEMVCSQWRENLKLNITSNEVDPSLWNERMTSADYDITNLTGGNGLMYNGTGSINDWTGCNSGGWGTRFMMGTFINEGDNAFEDTEDIARLKELGKLLNNEVDAEKTAEYWAEVAEIYTRNLYAIGIGRRLPAINIIKNNVHNVANLNQDWAYGFCGSSRGDTYWFG